MKLNAYLPRHSNMSGRPGITTDSVMRDSHSCPSIEESTAMRSPSLFIVCKFMYVCEYARTYVCVCDLIAIAVHRLQIDVCVCKYARTCVCVCDLIVIAVHRLTIYLCMHAYIPQKKGHVV